MTVIKRQMNDRLMTTNNLNPSGKIMIQSSEKMRNKSETNQTYC